ncbi:MAG: O-methyltransferase, family 3 [Gammaproteobacteria bacterium]|jgi:caffeoyl-CoA O-methyltransferase|nr:O-methyltransferase, family 3 [Gammaproteobacteria bacterium]
MTTQTISLTPILYDYLLSTSCREPELFKQVRNETAQLKQAKMQIAPDQGQFMALLLKLMNAKKALEIGVFTGYSALWIASGLPVDGKLIACEISEEWASMATDNWQKAGLAEKIELRLAPALITLNQLIATEQAGTFDFVFIDADKVNQETYYELALQLVRSGGLILLDNTLWYGKVADALVHDNSTQMIRALNAKLHLDERVDISLIAMGDGLMLARKR